MSGLGSTISVGAAGSASSLTADIDAGVLARHLARLAALGAEGFKRPRRQIGAYMVGEIQDNLDGQRLAADGDTPGGAMPQSKAAIKRRGKTLIHKHHLYDSYTYQLGDAGLEVGSNSVYAAIHHFGGQTGGSKHRFTMLARPVMGISRADEAVFNSFVIAEIERALQ